MAVVQTLIGNVKGPAGATGATGAQGPQGDAATIAVGSVTSAAYGTPASVTNSGTSGAAVFDFVIPQGKPGEKTTKMGELVLDTITTSTADFPSPAVDDTGAIAFGKIRKFFADTLSALASKIDTSKIANNLTTTDTSYVLSAAQGKALNDSLAALSTQSFSTMTQNISGGTVANNNCKKTGRIVTFLFRQYGISATANGVICTLPEGFRPTYECYGGCFIYIGTTAIPVYSIIAANGSVSLAYSTGQTMSQVCVYGTFSV